MILPCSPRSNPFRSAQIESLEYRGASAEEVLDRFEAAGFRGALVGACGTGKTTFLREIHAALERRGHLVEHWWLKADEAPPGRREILRRGRERDARTVLTFDGAEQLGILRWRSVLRSTRRCAGLLITSHSSGRLPTLHRHETSLDRALELVESLEPAGVESASGRARVQELHARHRGNLREVFRYLYIDRA